MHDQRPGPPWIGEHRCPRCRRHHRWREIAYHLWFSFSRWRCRGCGSSLGFDSTRHFAAVVLGTVIVAALSAPFRPVPSWLVIVAVVLAITLVGGFVASIRLREPGGGTGRGDG